VADRLVSSPYLSFSSLQSRTTASHDTQLLHTHLSHCLPPPCSLIITVGLNSSNLRQLDQNPPSFFSQAWTVRRLQALFPPHTISDPPRQPSSLHHFEFLPPTPTLHQTTSMSRLMMVSTLWNRVPPAEAAGDQPNPPLPRTAVPNARRLDLLLYIINGSAALLIPAIQEQTGMGFDSWWMRGLVVPPAVYRHRC